MNKKEKLNEVGYENLVYIPDNNLDDAIIGVTDTDNVVYDYNKIIDLLIQNEGFNYIEAMEWVNNSSRSLIYMKDKAPIIMYPIDW